MNNIRNILRAMLIRFKVYPHIFFTFRPFKIYEFKELLKGIKFSQEQIILDIGCESGLQTMLLAKKCKKAIGIDISEQDINVAKRRLLYTKKQINCEFRRIKIEDAGFQDAYFDKIFSISVIEHISNYREVLMYAYSLLKPDGQMVFSVDSLETIEDTMLIEKHKKDHLVEHYFNKEEVTTLIEKIGFNRITIYPIFKSLYAKQLFIKGINKGFACGYFRSILAYYILKHKENCCISEDKGLFLIVKCYK